MESFEELFLGVYIDGQRLLESLREKRTSVPGLVLLVTPVSKLNRSPMVKVTVPVKSARAANGNAKATIAGTARRNR